MIPNCTCEWVHSSSCVNTTFFISGLMEFCNFESIIVLGFPGRIFRKPETALIDFYDCGNWHPLPMYRFNCLKSKIFTETEWVDHCFDDFSGVEMWKRAETSSIYVSRIFNNIFLTCIIYNVCESESIVCT